ncbi:MAG: prepilin-type N-terminal cleavage/methylation domain-containing protein [Gemmatimonadales bacterium]
MRSSRGRPTTRGFTLIELMISLVIGVLILSSALSYAMVTLRVVDGNTIRDEVNRNARFIAMSLDRDLMSTGVGLQSTTSFGSLSAYGDTLVTLSVPYDPNEAPPYTIYPPAGTNNPLDPGGTCGGNCIDFLEISGAFDVEVGDLARLQVNSTRHLLLVSGVSDMGGYRAVTFTSADTLMEFPAGFSGGLLLDRFSTVVQKLAPVMYYARGDTLMRATGLNADGTPAGEVLAYGVQSWNVDLIFMDGDIAANADDTDADVTNDYDDIMAIRIQATLAADHPDPRVMDGTLFTRQYEWRFSPRNLMYQSNTP